MSKEEEAAFLTPFFEAASKGGILVVRDIKQALDAHLGRTVPLSAVYNLLHRHNLAQASPGQETRQGRCRGAGRLEKNSRN
jgi:hypothetical protein